MATPNIFDAALRSWQQTQRAAQLMGTNRPKIPTIKVPAMPAPSQITQPRAILTQPQTASVTTQAPQARPAAALLAEQQYQADKTAAAAANYARNAAAREAFSQGLMGARGGAADIYGGRAPALLGQAVTGAQRNMLTQQVADAIQYNAELEALRRAYSEAVGSAYSGLAETALDRANQRAAVAAQINRLGIG